MAQENGEKLLAKNYLLIKYEDLCAKPRDTIKKLFYFLRISVSQKKFCQIVSLVPPPSPSIGRWRRENVDLLKNPGQQLATALERLGYKT
ncbi:MAG: sulfotransferase domain-containing protein [Candidatus Anammoxibacter sp.]